MRAERPDERGMVTAFVTIFTVAVIFTIGLVLDGGNLLIARREAANVAESAARAGAQAIDEAALRDSGVYRLDPDGARAAAQDYLALVDRDGTVTVAGDSVTVTVEIDRPLYILGIGGLADVTVRGEGTARNVRGVSVAET